MTSFLELQLSWSVGSFRLAMDVTMSARSVGIFGRSGAGKSSVLAMLAGLVKPDAGRIAVAGETLFDAARGISVAPERRHVGLVFQDGRLFPHLTVAANLRYGLRLRAPAERRFRIEEIVALLEIGPFLERRPARLSGGERQRVAVGRALLASPRMLLFDEPCAALDRALRSQLLAFLVRVRNELQIPFLYVSHDLEEMQRLVDEVVILEQGQVLGVGPFPDVLVQEPVLRLAGQLSLDNILEVKAGELDPSGAGVRVALNGHPLLIPAADVPAGSRFAIHIRPEDVVLALERVDGVSARNQIPGRVTAVHSLVDRVLVVVDVGQPLRVEVSEQSARELELAEGRQVVCLFKTLAIRV